MRSCSPFCCLPTGVPAPPQQDRYSHVVDLTDGQNATAPHATAAESRDPHHCSRCAYSRNLGRRADPAGAPRGSAGSYGFERNGVAVDGSPQISLDDIAAWESQHGMIPQGAVVAIRRAGARGALSTTAFPMARDAAEFLIDARYTIGFAVETQVNLASDRTLAQQLALHGSYVVEGTARFTALPATGSLVIVAPAKNKKTARLLSASWLWSDSRCLVPRRFAT